MGIPLEVKWVERSGQTSQHIRSIGGDSLGLHWRHTETEAIDAIERDQFTYFVKKGAGGVRLSVGLTANSEKYLTILAFDGDVRCLMELPQY